MTAIIAIASAGLLAAAVMQIIQVREFEARIKDAYEDGYYKGYADRALGRSRFSSLTAKADRDENKEKTPAERQLDRGNRKTTT